MVKAPSSSTPVTLVTSIVDEELLSSTDGHGLSILESIAVVGHPRMGRPVIHINGRFFDLGEDASRWDVATWSRLISQMCAAIGDRVHRRATKEAHRAI